MTWLLVLPLLLNCAKTADVDQAWVFEADSKNNMDNAIAEATAWVSEALAETDNNLGNRFTLNLTNTPILACTTTAGKEGKCVKPQFCMQELPETDTTLMFTYRYGFQRYQHHGTNFESYNVIDLRYRESGCHYLLQCCELDQVKTIPKKTKTLPEGCGWSNPGGYRFRISESDTTGFSDFADFPWMVALLKKSHSQVWSKDDYIGGGTLIHRSVVLAAAHNTGSKKPDELKCRAGEWDTKVENEIFIHQDRDVRKIVVHDKFLLMRAHYDAALLFLESPFMLKDVYHIGVACLARDMPAPGTLCYSMGWGSSFNDTNNATLLKKIQVPMVDDDTCQKQLRKTILGPKYLLHNSLCCAGGEAGKDTCIGDGGSSLVCPVQDDNSTNRYSVYGMVAYGVGCGQKDVPGVYAKVPVMVDWINRKMQEEQLNSTSYSI